ncbi:MAG: hypothetical protein Fur006_40920 [Coleofasciculaceae cyanobacterium]
MSTEALDSREQDDKFNTQPLLPRNAWTSQVSYLKAIFKAKQALDQREKAQLSQV